GHPMADNVSRLVVRAAASRLKLEQFAVQDEVDEAGNTIESDAVSALRSWLRRFWLVNQWGRLQYENAFAFLRDGNSALALSWRPGREPGTGDVRVSREPWWDGETGMFVAYDEEGEPIWA